jgi:hypothetical protein
MVSAYKALSSCLPNDRKVSSTLATSPYNPDHPTSRRKIKAHCKKRYLRSVPFLKQFRLFTENSGKELNVKESSLKISEEVFP